MNTFVVCLVPLQNAANGEKCFEALLSHVIGELSSDETIYRLNAAEPTVVRKEPLTNRTLSPSPRVTPPRCAVSPLPGQVSLRVRVFEGSEV